MKIEKIVLDTMERCYAASSLTIDGSLYAVLAEVVVGIGTLQYNNDRRSDNTL
jgi:hypothetical protein